MGIISLWLIHIGQKAGLNMVSYQNFWLYIGETSLELPMKGKCKYAGDLDDKKRPYGIGEAIADDGARFYGTWLKGSWHGICGLIQSFK